MLKLVIGALTCLLALTVVVSFVVRPEGDLGSAAITMSAIVMGTFGIVLGYQAIARRLRQARAFLSPRRSRPTA